MSSPHSLQSVDNFRHISEQLDKLQSKGFAAKNPELVGRLVLAAAIDGAGDAIAKSLNSLQDSLRTDHPLMGETFSGITDSIADVAQSIREFTEKSQ